MSLFDIFKNKEEEEKVAEQEQKQTQQIDDKADEDNEANRANEAQDKTDETNDEENSLAQSALKEMKKHEKNATEQKNNTPKQKASTNQDKKTLEINKAKEVKRNNKPNNLKPKNTANFVPKKPKKVTQPIIVTYVDEKGDKIANDYRFTGNLGDVLRMDDIPTIPGFKFVTKGRPKYTVSEQIQNVKIVCKKDIISYRLIPVTENGKKISNAQVKTLQGQPDSPIDPAKYPQVAGYTAYQSRQYKVPKENSDIKITYGALPQTVHVIYQTDSGKKLDETVLKGKTGEKYTIDLRANKFPGYEINDQPGSLTNFFDPKVSRQVVHFAPITTKVIVEFLDENGNSINKSQTYSGKYHQSYRINLPKIPGFELVSDSTLLSGTFDKTNKTIVLRFRKSTVSFHINFWFDQEKTKSAGNSRTISGIVGDLYNINIPQLDGYTPSIQRVEGKFKALNNSDYDVIYKRIHCDLTVVLDDLTGHQLKGVKPLKISGDWGQPFKIDLPQIDGYERPTKMYEGRFKQITQVDHVNYQPKTVELMVSYVDAKTKKEIPSYPAQQVSGTVGLTYNISPQLIDGYRVTQMPDNASGVFTAEPKNVVFEYEPVPSELVIHKFGNAHTPLGKSQILKGYYGEPYEIKPDTIPGYDFESSSIKLKGTFPATRQDVELRYNAANVKFRLVPTNEKNKPIDDRYIMDVSGLVNERWSLLLPEIPGYNRPQRKGSDESVARIGDYIRPQMDGKDIKLKYSPKDETVTIHFIFKGGSHDGQHPFKDFVLNGKMDAPYKAKSPKREGYTPDPVIVKGHYTDEQQDITVYYNVNYETYIIQYVDPNGKVVSSESPAKGYYGQAIEIKDLPEGYNLPEISNTNIILDGKGTVQDKDGNYKGIYQVPVEPKDVMVNISAQTKDGMSLGVGHQIYGKYHQPQTYEVEDITGYTPVNGKNITINFELDQHNIPIIYEPKTSKITVRYFSTEGVAIKEPKVYEGKYQQEYSITAPSIPGYMVVSDDVRHGTYGAQDIDMAFTYRAGSDTQSKAIIPLDELLDDDVSETNTNDSPVETMNVQTSNAQASDTTELPDYTGDIKQPTPAKRSNQTQKPETRKAEMINQEPDVDIDPDDMLSEEDEKPVENQAAEQAIKPAPASKPRNNADLDPHKLFKKQN